MPLRSGFGRNRSSPACSVDDLCLNGRLEDAGLVLDAIRNHGSVPTCRGGPSFKPVFEEARVLGRTIDVLTGNHAAVSGAIRWLTGLCGRTGPGRVQGWGLSGDVWPRPASPRTNRLVMEGTEALRGDWSDPVLRGEKSEDRNSNVKRKYRSSKKRCTTFLSLDFWAFPSTLGFRVSHRLRLSPHALLK